MVDKTPEVIINPNLVEPTVKTHVGPSVKNKLGIQKSNLEIIDIIFYIILIIILILYLFQYNSLKNIKNEKTILQKSKPNKEEIEDIIKNKYPTIFTSMIEDWEVNDDLNITKEEFDINTKPFNIPLCVAKKYDRIELVKDFSSKVFKETSTRNILFLLEGIVRLYIFTPNQYNKIEVIKNQSSYNIWEDPEEFNGTEYTEIVFSEGQVIYIPYGWLYCYYIEEDCDMLMAKSESIFSIILRNFIK